MKLVWKLTIVNAAAMIAAVLLIFWVFYSTIESRTIGEQKKLLLSWFKNYYMHLEMQRGAQSAAPGRWRTTRFRRITIIEDGRIINDPFNVAKKLIKKNGIQKINEEYYFTLYIKANREYLLATEITGVIRTLNLISKNMLIFSFISVGIFTTIAFILSKYSLRPIKLLSNELSKISPENLSYRIQLPKSKDELFYLTREINLMLERIEKAYESQERFVHDVSHELRTPVTSMKGFINILKKWGCKDKEIFNEAVEELDNLSNEMMNLINNLLLLARSSIIKPENVDTKELIYEILKQLKNIYPNKNVHVDGYTTIYAPKESIKTVLRNLIENALKFSKENVWISLQKNKITIEDDGPGIPDGEKEKIFDKFYRTDKARDRRTPGHGIGLSIVKTICDSLSIKVKVEDSEKGGAKFTLIWPENS